MSYQPYAWASEFKDWYDWGYSNGYHAAENGDSSSPPYNFLGQMLIEGKKAAAYHGYLEGYQDFHDGLDCPDGLDGSEPYDDEDEDC
jgi:hypothetical protein